MTMLNKSIQLSLLAITVAACGPIPVYYREGASVDRLDADNLSCKVAALKDAPVENQIRQHPPRYYPGKRVCADGSCWTRPGYWVDGQVYTVDVNLGLRKQLEQSCMANKGYSQVALKRCTMEEVSSRLASQPARLPPLNEQACVWQSPDKQLRILSP
jgi:hypothetical protein